MAPAPAPAHSMFFYYPRNLVLNTGSFVLQYNSILSVVTRWPYHLSIDLALLVSIESIPYGNVVVSASGAPPPA